LKKLEKTWKHVLKYFHVLSPNINKSEKTWRIQLQKLEKICKRAAHLPSRFFKFLLSYGNKTKNPPPPPPPPPTPPPPPPPPSKAQSLRFGMCSYVSSRYSYVFSRLGSTCRNAFWGGGLPAPSLLYQHFQIFSSFFGWNLYITSYILRFRWTNLKRFETAIYKSFHVFPMIY
jgi:hypothetical protein